MGGSSYDGLAAVIATGQQEILMVSALNFVQKLSCVTEGKEVLVNIPWKNVKNTEEMGIRLSTDGTCYLLLQHACVDFAGNILIARPNVVSVLTPTGTFLHNYTLAEVYCLVSLADGRTLAMLGHQDGDEAKCIVF